MKFPVIIFLLFSLFTNAQVNFKKGYLIDNNNNEISCYIKNIDWKKNPNDIIYRLNENSSIEKIPLNELKEFRITGTDLFYKRYSISNEIVTGEMGAVKRLVLLKVLIDAESDLLEYYMEGKYYFFYEKENELVLLDYQKSVDANNKITENNKFKKQLFDNFECADILLEDYSKLRYNSTNLSEFFLRYNKCTGKDFENIYRERTKPKFNIKLRGGLNLNSDISMVSNSYALSYTIPPFSAMPQGQDVVRFIESVEKYNAINNFSFGLELEIRLPFDRNKWSGFVSPNYQSISEISGRNFFSEPNVVDIDIVSSMSYTFIQLPIGFRRYFDLSDNLELYLQVAYTQNILLDSEVKTEVTTEATSTREFNLSSRFEESKKSNSGGYLGIGLNLSKKYAIEINYFTTNLNLDDKNTSSMKGFSINALYTIF